MLITLLMMSCSKEEMKTIEDVTFSLSYEMNITSGSMTRANGSSLYTEFYENYIKTKKVGYPSYTLTFYKDDKEVATFNGEWDATLITLPEGIYKIKGSSANLKSMEHSTYALEFNETIQITKNQTTLTLHPSWNCFLVFFDNNHIQSAKLRNTYGGDEINFYQTENISYIFISGVNSNQTYLKILYQTNDNDSGSIQINQMGFENGKYYFLDKLITTYEIPPMNSGF